MRREIATNYIHEITRRLHQDWLLTQKEQQALERLSKEIVKKYLAKNPWESCKPSTLARASLYLAGKLLSLSISQNDIGKAFYYYSDSSPSTISLSRVYRKLAGSLDFVVYV